MSCYFPSLHLAVSKYSLSFFLYFNPSTKPMTGRNNKQLINNRNKIFILIPKGRFANVFFLTIVFLFINVLSRSVAPTQLKSCPKLFRCCYKFHSSSQSSSIKKPSRRCPSTIAEAGAKVSPRHRTPSGNSISAK